MTTLSAMEKMLTKYAAEAIRFQFGRPSPLFLDDEPFHAFEVALAEWVNHASDEELVAAFRDYGKDDED